MASFFSSRNTIIFAIVVAAQGATGYYLNARQEIVPQAKPLASLAQQLDDWTMIKEWPMEAEVQAVLRADDTVSRQYVRAGVPQGAGLFVAFFRSQRAGVAPHSPKNCLPGNGWVAEKSTVISVPVPGRETPVEANYYVVQRGDNKSVVVYWYQSHGRTVADEYKAKYYVMSDAIRYNRTDTALVRVTVAVGPAGVQEAEQAALDFVRKFYQPLSQILPA
ncbi:MAG TPA: EpsI family protein [Bryobacteraceae bacterium]|nr:EpsI family protein [Bryobacteraceae bacterium]